ncbi:MAG TPA: AraC family transcriptional regulator [Acidaminococcaceae bacterium]|nr:AraC family transcriptional regulator [Acidaminococcaceae bacterium]
MDDVLQQAIGKLGDEFPHLHWNFRPDPAGGRNARISQWLGGEEEEVMVCAFVGRHIHEAFHRQDFFFLNFAYRGDYRALSARFDNEILVREGDCYIGQPYSGYALRGNSDRNLVIAGLLIRKDVFFNEYLAPLSSEPDMLRFFLEPKIDRFSDEFIHFTLARTSPIWKLLELMMVEYADRQEDTQQVLKPLIFSTLMLAAREYRRQYPREQHGSVAAAMTFYMERHLDGITLGDLAQHFGYHPNYISALLHRETGRTFSQILLEKRMQRAVLLLKNTDLPVEHVAEMTGYGNPSNFYKAFRSFYGMPPRVYLGQ